MAFLDVPSARLRYDVVGEGKPLFFVHGAGANGAVFFQQVAYFQHHYRVITLDMRGFGGSVCEPERFHPRLFSEDLARLMDVEARGVPAAVVCQSMGAWSGLPLAVREPDRFAALVLSNTPTPAYGPHHEALKTVSERFGRAAAGGKVTPQELGFTDRFVDERPDLLALYQMLARMNQKLDLSLIHDPALRLLAKDFVGYKVPTIVMGGLKNRLLAPDTHIQAASCIPGASSYSFPESGHSSYFEEPEHYNRVVHDFLQAQNYV